MIYYLNRLLLMLICLGGMIACRTEKTEQKPQSFFPVIPEKGIYLGAYVDFGEGEAEVTLEAIEKFQ